jgi:hypothetical protein
MTPQQPTKTEAVLLTFLLAVAMMCAAFVFYAQNQSKVYEDIAFSDGKECVTRESNTPSWCLTYCVQSYRVNGAIACQKGVREEVKETNVRASILN